MLAELAAANAAFGVIKSFVSNGKELASCGKHISDFVIAKEKNPTYLKNKIFKKLDSIGAKYPAEHNVGHFYKADKDLANFYKELDPSNSFNAGIGKLSKNKFYRTNDE